MWGFIYSIKGTLCLKKYSANCAMKDKLKSNFPPEFPECNEES